MPDDAAEPAVTCLCPTYGRFERLRDALACWLLQTYPHRRLIVLNDAEDDHLTLGPEVPGVTVWNVRPRCATLGHKRQMLLRAAHTPLVAHWDDDDLYLPGHLSRCVAERRERLLAGEPCGCIKPRRAWWAVGPPAGFAVRGPRANTFEGQMVFDRARALEHGGYPPMVSGQARALLRRFGKAGELYKPARQPQALTYVYRWGDGVGHISAAGNNARSHEQHAARNGDWSRERPIIDADDPIAWARDRIHGQLCNLVRGARPHLDGRAAYAAMARRTLAPWIGGET